MRLSFYLEKLEDFVIDKVEGFFYVRHYHFTRIGEKKKSKWLKPVFQKAFDLTKFFKKQCKVEWKGEVIGFSTLSYSSKDPTIDGYIASKGAIFNHADKKYYTNKRDYLDSLKRMGKTIDDN